MHSLADSAQLRDIFQMNLGPFNPDGTPAGIGSVGLTDAVRSSQPLPRSLRGRYVVVTLSLCCHYVVITWLVRVRHSHAVRSSCAWVRVSKGW